MIKNKIQQAFDRAADSYDDHSHVQQQVGMKLIQLIKLAQPNAESLLDLGCGTGITTQALAAQYQYRDFQAIDIAPSLLKKAYERLHEKKIKINEMNFDRLSNDYSSFDIIYSNMALQWSINLSILLQNLRSLLHEKAHLAFSIPLAGTFMELEPHCALNPFYEMEAISDFLIQHQYEIIKQEKENIILEFNHPLTALKSIKQIGANHVHQREHKGLKTQSSFAKFHAKKLTYVIGYFIARKL
jgi:malonyl-CoA O-methyltransferase